MSFNNQEDRTRINERIRISPVQVIQDGQNLGSMPTAEALKRAREVGMDLVEISPNSRPPVCRIMDYGKFKYEQSLKLKEQKKNCKNTQPKEVWLRPVTQAHDLETKTKAVIKFLEEGHPVNVKIEFKAREVSHKELGYDILKSIVDAVGEKGSARKPSMLGKIINCFIEPKK